MSNGSVLPPDIKNQLEASARARRTGGIGAAVPENAAAARAREVAMNPDGAMDEVVAAPKPVVEEKKELTTCPNGRCAKPLQSEWSFCAHCGTDLLRAGAAAKLGIEFTEQDVHDYLFRGYVVRDLKILGNHKITVKSSQPLDADAIDRYLMNGDWAKNNDGTERKISEFYLRQINSLCVTATAVIKFDGASIGDTLEDRIKWLNERGSAVVDMMNSRVVLFNRALTEFLEKADTISGS